MDKSEWTRKSLCAYIGTFIFPLEATLLNSLRAKYVTKKNVNKYDVDAWWKQKGVV